MDVWVGKPIEDVIRKAGQPVRTTRDGENTIYAFIHTRVKYVTVPNPAIQRVGPGQGSLFGATPAATAAPAGIVATGPAATAGPQASQSSMLGNTPATQPSLTDCIQKRVTCSLWFTVNPDRIITSYRYEGKGCKA